MAVPTNKAELLAAIDKTFARLIADLREVPAETARLPGVDGHARGTVMSCGDLVAYLIGWNELVLKWLALDASGAPISFPEVGYKWNELGRLAGKFYRDYESLAYPELLERLEAAKQRIVAAIEARSNDELYGRPWYDGKWTMGRMIQFNTASPYDNACGRLRRWRKANAG